MLKIVLVFLTFSSSSFAADFSIMSYNVQNLFNTKHDEGHGDYTFLPLADKLKKECGLEKNPYYRKKCQKTNWTKKKLEKRIEQLSKVIRTESVDLLALVEIEDLDLALKLGKSSGLKKGVITSGSDRRGIQSALVYNENIWQLVKKSEHKFSFVTRNLLEVHLKNKEGKELVVFVNHWPSQGSKTPKRVTVASKVVERVNFHQKKGRGVVVVGDFNTIATENPHPINKVLLGETKLKENQSITPTYFYGRKMIWNFFDRIFYSGPLKNKKTKVVKVEECLGLYENKDKSSKMWGSRIVGTPKKVNFEKKKMKGCSDHFPVHGEFSWK